MNRSALVPVIGCVLLVACTTEQVLVREPVGSIVLTSPYPAMSPGEKHQIEALLTDADGELIGARAVDWSALDPGVATVDDEGMVTALSAGTVRIRGEVDGVADTVELPVLSEWSSVTVLDRLVCADRWGGGTRCWGDQVGDGTRTTRFSAVALAGVTTFAQIDRMSGVTCGLGGDDLLRCWSTSPFYSRLFGNGATVDTFPTPVAAAGGKTFAEFSGGYLQACGVDLAGQGWCWGDQVYYGVSALAVVQRSVPDSVEGGLTWKTLKAGSFATCGLVTSGEAYCFGAGDFLPHGILGRGFGVGVQPLPAPTVGGNVFDSLWVEGITACALTPDRRLFCWGGYDFDVPTEVDLPPVRTVAVGYNDVCAVTMEGRVYCWEGARPDGVPAPLETDLRFTGIGKSWQTTCGLTAGGGLYCWGEALLGAGRRAGSPTPVRVEDLE